MTLVLGVDGGNSKTIALVARDDGTIIGSGRQLGAADIYAAGVDAAMEITDAAVDAALAEAGAERGAVGRAVFSMAGADWPEDIVTLRTALEDRGFGGPVQVVNDAIGALFGAVPRGPAVVVSLGTGAATGARGRSGATWHSSFWQVTQGADQLARTALGSAVRAELGTGPATDLREGLLRATGDPDVESLLHRLTARERPAPPVIGAVVRALLAAADGGDAVAVEIVERHGSGIGELAAVAARRVGAAGDRYALSFGGGLTRAGAGRLIDAAMTAVERAGQAPVRVSPRWEPAIGAIVIGLAPERRDWESVARRLDATAPEATLFELLDRADRAGDTRS